MDRTAGVVVVAAALACAAGAARGEAEEARGAGPGFTLGHVQAQLRQGLSQAEVVERIGSPNILTRDAEGREAWVYDRVSTERESSASGVSIGGLGSGASGNFGGLVGIGAGKRSEKSRTSQRTLTVVVRFSKAGTVDSFSWHDSRF